MSGARFLVVGGLRRLDAHYRDVASAPRAEVEIDCANEDCPSLEARAVAAHGIVLVLGHLSHPTAAKVRGIARRRGIPLVTASGSSVSRVRASVAALWRETFARPLAS